MKKLLKSVICGSVNSASVEKLTNASLKKKKSKEKGKTRILAKCGRVTLNPNDTFVYCLILNESRLFTLKITIS